MKKNAMHVLKQLHLFVKLFTKHARKRVYSEALNDKTENWKPVRKEGAIKY